MWAPSPGRGQVQGLEDSVGRNTQGNRHRNGEAQRADARAKTTGQGQVRRVREVDKQ